MCIPEVPSTQYLRALVKKTIPFMVFGMRTLWVYKAFVRYMSFGRADLSCGVMNGKVSQLRSSQKRLCATLPHTDLTTAER